MVATSSGLIELSEGEIHPDYLASTIGNFYYIRGQIANQGISEQNHFMASYPDKIARFDGKEDGYIPVHGTSERIPRLFYFNYVRPSYNAPTLPKTHHKAQGVRTRWGK